MLPDHGLKTVNRGILRRANKKMGIKRTIGKRIVTNSRWFIRRKMDNNLRPMTGEKAGIEEVIWIDNSLDSNRRDNRMIIDPGMFRMLDTLTMHKHWPITMMVVSSIKMPKNSSLIVVSHLSRMVSKNLDQLITWSLIPSITSMHLSLVSSHSKTTLEWIRIWTKTSTVMNNTRHKWTMVIKMMDKPCTWTTKEMVTIDLKMEIIILTIIRDKMIHKTWQTINGWIMIQLVRVTFMMVNMLIKTSSNDPGSLIFKHLTTAHPHRLTVAQWNLATSSNHSIPQPHLISQVLMVEIKLESTINHHQEKDHHLAINQLPTINWCQLVGNLLKFPMIWMVLNKIRLVKMMKLSINKELIDIKFEVTNSNRGKNKILNLKWFET